MKLHEMVANPPSLPLSHVFASLFPSHTIQNKPCGNVVDGNLPIILGSRKSDLLECLLECCLNARVEEGFKASQVLIWTMTTEATCIIKYIHRSHGYNGHHIIY